MGVRFMVSGEESGGGVSLIEHPVGERMAAGPPHTHSREDEYSYVVEGEFAVLIGDRLVTAGPGSLVFKPRGIPHTFWLTSEAPGKILEIISPAGFEHFFEKMLDLPRGQSGPDRAAMASLWNEYGITMHFERLPEIVKTYGLTVPDYMTSFRDSTQVQ